MKEALKNLEAQLNIVGKKVELERTAVEVSSTGCIDSVVPSSAGIYWIETTMPISELASAISTVTGKSCCTRKTKPQGGEFIEQNGNSFYVAYSGTEENLRKRLRQHLFNEGSVSTVKLGCVISQAPFSNFKWRVGFVEIESYELRYALEAWWRLKVGWPVFCRR